MLPTLSAARSSSSRLRVPSRRVQAGLAAAAAKPLRYRIPLAIQRHGAIESPQAFLGQFHLGKQCSEPQVLHAGVHVYRQRSFAAVQHQFGFNLAFGHTKMQGFQAQHGIVQYGMHAKVLQRQAVGSDHTLPRELEIHIHGAPAIGGKRSVGQHLAIAARLGSRRGGCTEHWSQVHQAQLIGCDGA